MGKTFLTQEEKIYLRTMRKRGKKVPKEVLDKIFGNKYDPNYNYWTGKTNN